MHPVVFTKENEEDAIKDRVNMTLLDRPGSYKVKHRPKSRTYVTGHEQNNKIIDITIDHKSESEESMLHSLSVDDVLRHTLDNKRSYRSEDSLDGSSYFDQNGISPRMDDSKEIIRSPSKISLVDSHVSDRSDLSSKNSRAKVVTLNYSISKSKSSDLMVGPPSGSLVRSNTDMSLKSAGSVRGSERSYRNGDRSGSKHGYRSSSGRSGRVGSPASFGLKGETEYIQISSQIKMPNPISPQPIMTKQEEYISQAKSNEAIRQVSKQNKALNVVEKEREVKQTTPAPAPSPEVPPIEEKEEIKVADGRRSVTPSSAAVAINIPTAEQFEGESPWSTHRTGTDVDAIPPSRLKKDGSDLQKISETLTEKTVKFKDDLS
jgi:hypothetical protein